MPWDPDAEAFRCDGCDDWADAAMALTAGGPMALQKPDGLAGRLPPLPFQAQGAKTLCYGCWAIRNPAIPSAS